MSFLFRRINQVNHRENQWQEWNQNYKKSWRRTINIFARISYRRFLNDNNHKDFFNKNSNISKKFRQNNREILSKKNFESREIDSWSIEIDYSTYLDKNRQKRWVYAYFRNRWYFKIRFSRIEVKTHQDHIIKWRIEELNARDFL